MKLKTLCVAMLLAAGSIGIAYANPNLITNGDFSNTSGLTAPSHNPAYTNQQVGYQGFTVNNWTGGGYTIWYPNANDAVTGCGYTQYHYPGSGSGDCSTLNAVGTPVPGTNGTFLALDGVSGSLQGSMAQTVGGLTAGHTYAVTFYWGTSQETQASSAQPSHDQWLQVSLGSGASQTTTSTATLWGYFTGDGCQTTGLGACAWNKTTMMFKADSASDLLTFLSFGQPSDGPPMILLTGVSMTNVPEPSSLGMFGGGVLGLGLLTLFMRRRALRKQGAAGDLA